MNFGSRRYDTNDTFDESEKLFNVNGWEWSKVRKWHGTVGV